MIALDAQSKVPPYEQLRSWLARQITSGDLPVGARLPTVRAQAAELGLAANTVARAYRELEEAGLVETRGRAGTFVSAAGQESRARASAAAASYALLTRELGMSASEAMDIVRAAIRNVPRG